ncbi:TetR/AcrR family transcriptional regulator [Seonamhaeicola marinus]|uniref:TetR/AcrR family transcriptional regulator n=1 Tax=Seonamhaeicola marinus TaxID=1912246 RepID=A0A5D0HV53_9FLAO|nr:TetR/AcrR family transcriptional regulator [Seonamhaeicola marinus]TYA74750.1 TetR/AcrR family transcriptional regulator [Seonamhaeicola marinus]
MRPQKVLEDDILVGLTQVFRARGYEGASLKELADATGLKKASLYHRFPSGKQEMAEAVLGHVSTWADQKVFKPLLNSESFPPEVRLKEALTQIKTLYNDGKNTCILRALSMEDSLYLFESHIQTGMNKWINAFTQIAEELNFSKSDAKAEAVNTLINIQGSLVVSKGLNDYSIFLNTIKNIEDKYLNP